MYRLVLVVLLLCPLAACSGDGGNAETTAWVTISSPANGFVTNSASIVVEGNAAHRDGSYPSESVYWYNGGTSGVAENSVVCILACLMAWRATVPLYPGENTISIQFVDASASLEATRSPTVAVQGRISLSGGLGAADVTVSISGLGVTTSTRTDGNGEYTLTVLRTGNYSLTPSLPLPQSAGCLSFDPATLSVDVAASDISGQDFTATELTSCYTISGRITASTDPTLGQAGITVTLADAQNDTMQTVTDIGGYYGFHHLAAGTYTVTPSYCVLSFCNTFLPEAITVPISNGDAGGQDFVRQF